MATATVSSKGQVVIPAELRRNLGIGPGSQLEFVAEGTSIRVFVRRASEPSRLEEGIGLLRYSGPPRRLVEFDVVAEMKKARK
ncbi:MAG: AbrB/MazE/SpoVT family DNA-binding domain-containing protein [Deltaproteobacteria bacterium]|nr:AbrB/MazE/SpoVT family DNA-binding domain-containing protein [Deltaproteobacteria bacterium]